MATLDATKQRHPSADRLMAELAALYEHEFGRFSRVAAAVTGDVESARDVVQDAFANLVRHRRAHRGDASLAGWAWRTVLNTARTHQRTQRYRNEALERTAERERPADLATETTIETDTVLALVRELPERQRLVVFLRYYADLDYASIGEALSIRAGTVGAALNAAHATIRSELR